jgi:hypothetical protein
VYSEIEYSHQPLCESSDGETTLEIRGTGAEDEVVNQPSCQVTFDADQPRNL